MTPPDFVGVFHDIHYVLGNVYTLSACAIRVQIHPARVDIYFILLYNLTRFDKCKPLLGVTLMWASKRLGATRRSRSTTLVLARDAYCPCGCGYLNRKNHLILIDRVPHQLNSTLCEERMRTKLRGQSEKTN